MDLDQICATVRNLEPDYLLFFRMRSDPADRGDVNSLNLRGPEVPEKPQDEFRILSLPVAFRTNRSASWTESSGLTDRELFERRRSPLVRLSSLLFEYSNLFPLVALREQPLAQAPSFACQRRIAGRSSTTSETSAESGRFG